ncbi:MAG: class I SAM-dependent methyltransferase [Candidatus Aminicenantes bacterium]|nr:class I SAM-dependent methyltransferase [Candidatus Aminicenantes bacterium]
MSREKVSYYDKNWQEYDDWYDTHQAIYQSEIKALERVIPSGRGLEIGIGTGRFSFHFSVRFGLDPSFNMLKLAMERNIKVVQGFGEILPFKNESFHFISIVFTIELIADPLCFLKEAVRALKKNGTLILGIIDRNSLWGKFYKQKSAQSKFYTGFHFFSPEEILEIYQNINVEFKEAYQTLYQPPPNIIDLEEPKRGFGQGGFVVFKGIKKE